jgi:AcrR family transcriptional regulator
VTRGDEAAAGELELLWEPRAAPRRGPRPGLTPPGIAEVAIAIADAERTADVPLQRVAAELGVTSMALYRYVRGKRGLVALMIDLAIGPPPPAEQMPSGWRAALDHWARLLLAGFLRHPWLLGATARQRVLGPNELAWLECGVRAVSGTGLTGGEAIDTVVVLLGHVRSMAQVAGQDRDGAGSWNEAMAALVRRHGERYPALLAAVEEGALGAEDRDALEFGLRCVLAGIDALIADRRQKSAQT